MTDPLKGLKEKIENLASEMRPFEESGGGKEINDVITEAYKEGANVALKEVGELVEAAQKVVDGDVASVFVLRQALAKFRGGRDE